MPISGHNPVEIVDMGLIHVPEGRKLFPNLSVKENLELGSYRRGKTNRAKNLERVLEIFPKLKDRIGQTAGTLSGGERQILAISRALYFGAKILILDEPTSALGVKESNKVVEQITNLKKQNINVVLISHNIDQAFMLGDKFFVIKNGDLVAQLEKSETSAKSLRKILEK